MFVTVSNLKKKRRKSKIKQRKLRFQLYRIVILNRISAVRARLANNFSVGKTFHFRRNDIIFVTIQIAARYFRQFRQPKNTSSCVFQLTKVFLFI